MRRFSKVFSGIAVIMLGFGIMLIAIGFGSAKSDWERISGAQQGTDTVARTFDAASGVEIRAPLGNVQVGASPDEKLHFWAYNVRAEALEIAEQDGKITICTEGEGGTAARLISVPFLAEGGADGGFAFLTAGDAGYPCYVLFLPQAYEGGLDISLGAGEVSVYGISAGEMELFVDVGVLRTEACTAKKLSAGCDIGESIVSGAYEEISVQCDIGAVEVTLLGREEDYNGGLACGLGQLRYMRAAAPANAGELSERLEPAEYFDVSEKGGVDRSFEWDGAAAKGQLKVQCDIGEIEVRLVEPQE